MLVTTGPGTPDVLPASPGVLHASYVSQSLVLPHCAAVVSHGGAGTMLGALCHGLPQLCLPQGTDQPMNAAALVRPPAPVGRSPRSRSMPRIRLPPSWTRVLGDPALRASARRIAAADRSDAVRGRVAADLTG